MDISQEIIDQNIFCEIYNKKLSSIHSKQQHKRQVHEEVKDFECNVCNRVFGQKNELKKHVHNVHQQKHYNCSLCGNIFLLMQHTK